LVFFLKVGFNSSGYHKGIHEIRASTALGLRSLRSARKMAAD
jgi:hypothetical protein